MGITGLLPMVKNILKKTRISKYFKSRIAIDGHAWIHQVIPFVAYELYNNKPVQRHIDLFLNKIKTLQSMEITPIVVFDGDFLISKEGTNAKRTEQKNKVRLEVEYYIKKNNLPKAKELMKRCVSVTPEILHSILAALRANNIEYIVAPYEADAQLYYLQKINYVDYIITEDSDLIVYGCNKVLYKYSDHSIDEYNSNLLHLAKDSFFADNIVDIAILSGCDYLDSIKGVGLATAYKLLKETGSVVSFVKHMITLNKDVPGDYLDLYARAKTTFLSHIVYDPIKKQRTYLLEPSGEVEFLGTLDDIPLFIKTPFGKEQKLNRHHLPNTKLLQPQEELNLNSDILMNEVSESDLYLACFKD